MSVIRHLRAWCAAALCSLVLAAPAQAAPEAGKTFKDWTVGCGKVKVDDKEIESCKLYQVFGRGEGKSPLLLIAVTYVPNQEAPFLVLVMPLGMALTPGVQLQIDDSEVQRIPVNTCLPDGCRAGGAIGDDMLALLQKGKELKVSFADLNLKGITIPVSLAGFTAGLASLK